MYINRNKILNAKKVPVSPIREAYEELKNNDTAQNRILFMNKFRRQPLDKILENLSLIYGIPGQGADFMNLVFKTSHLGVDKLSVHKENLTEFINKLKDANYLDQSHIEELEGVEFVISSIIDKSNSINTIKDQSQLQFYSDRAYFSCTFESYLNDELEMILYNINYSPETISDYETLIRKIKMSHTTEYLSSFPKLLVTNTDMIVNLNIHVTGAVYELLISMPTVIAEKLVELKISKSQLRAYINILNKQRATLVREIKSGNSRQYNLYRGYLENIQNAIDILLKYGGVAVRENIAEMQPDIIPYEDGVVEDITAELEDEILDMMFDENEEVDDSIIESFANIYQKMNDILTEDNAIVKASVKAGDAAGKAGKKVIHSARKAIDTVKRVKAPVDKVKDEFTRAVNKTLDDIKKKDSDERRNRIITGQYRLKLANFLKKGILTIATGVAVGGGVPIVGPVIAIITTMTSLAIDKKLDDKERKKILVDLEGELKIVNEKLEDSRSDGDKKSKYELMRIKQKLEKDIERIKFHLDNS